MKQEKVAIVTGATGGIGSACVRELIRQGYSVVAMGTREKYELQEKVCYVRGSVTKEEDRKLAMEEALKLGNLKILVNVAGVAPAVRTDLLEMTEESYDRVMEINTKALLFMTQMVANYLVAHWKEGEFPGAIVNVSSMSAYTSSVSRGEYCISKAGVSMITKLFADRLSEYGITVNEVRPGIIHTGMTKTVEGKYDKLLKEGVFPIRRWGEPEDVAKAVGIFCSGALSYTTGQSLDVDGGFHIQRL